MYCIVKNDTTSKLCRFFVDHILIGFERDKSYYLN